jgi:hypothetical protein
MKTSSLLFFFLLGLTAFCFVKKTDDIHPSKKLTIVFHNQLGSKDLVLGEPIVNILGDTINIERFRYYVSNFSVKDNRGIVVKLPVEYFLIDEENPQSKSISFTVPDISIDEISFLLGVDSSRNVSGIQTGALDPLHGMFWTWNSGYIMAKLEGSSEKVHSAGNRFTYHVGGFRTGMNTTRTINLRTPLAMKSEEIHIKADVNRWFKGNSEINIAETPVCHSPGALAVKLADNYSSMFSIYMIQQ